MLLTNRVRRMGKFVLPTHP